MIFLPLRKTKLLVTNRPVFLLKIFPTTWGEGCYVVSSDGVQFRNDVGEKRFIIDEHFSVESSLSTRLSFASGIQLGLKNFEKTIEYVNKI